MTDEQKAAFESVTAHRRAISTALQDPVVVGIWKNVVDMYAGRAHFVYELLQNADDANATTVWFELEKTRLVFRHDGRHFSVTKRPQESGDVNVITSIGNSEKAKDTNTIGKFGVGFKAVFQYTEQPVIYDRDFCFRLEHYIVPELVDVVPPDIDVYRKLGQTIFEFPFKHNRLDCAIDEISERLSSLDRPMLFLNSLRHIHVSTPERAWQYSFDQDIIKPLNGATRFEKVVCRKIDSGTLTNDSYLKVSRQLNWRLSYSIAFAMSSDWTQLIPCSGPAYCYFPTRDDPKLKFLIHAPFLVTNNRGNIQDSQHNANLIGRLGLLAADAFVFMRDWGINRNVAIINDSVFNILPTAKTDFFETYRDSMRREQERPRFFAPIFSCLRTCMQNRCMLSTVDSEPLALRYVDGSHAYWAESTELVKLFDNTLLAELVGEANAKWVFTSSGRPVASWEKNALRDYKDSLIKDWFSFDHLLEMVTPEFLARRSTDWLEKFYRHIQKRHSSASELEDIASRAVFRCADGTFRPATKLNSAEKPQPCLFLPSEETDFAEVPLLDPVLLKSPELSKFFRDTLRLAEPSIRDHVFNTILPKYTPTALVTSPIEDMKLIFRAWRGGNEQDKCDIVEAVRNTPCLLSDDGRKLRQPSTLYIPSNDLQFWFDGLDVHFLSDSIYRDAFKSEYEEFLRFISNLEVLSIPRKISRKPTEAERDCLRDDYHQFPASSDSSGFGRRWTIADFEGFESVLNRVLDNHDRNLSILVWDTLIREIEREEVTALDDLFKSNYKFFYYQIRSVSFPSPILATLRQSRWLCSDSGEWIAPENAHIRNLTDYSRNTPSAEILIQGLGVSEAAPGMTPEDEAKIRGFNEFQRFLNENGLTQEEAFQLLKSRKQPSTTANGLSAAEGIDLPKGEETVIAIGDPNAEQFPTKRVHAPQTIIGTTEKEAQKEAPKESPKTTPIDRKTPDERLAELEAETNLKRKKILDEQAVQSSIRDRNETSFGWFLDALAYGNLSANQNGSPKQKFSVSFGSVERDKESERTLVLSIPNRDVPSQLAEQDDIRIEMRHGDAIRTFRATGASIDSDRVVVLLSKEETIDGFDFSNVDTATISVSDPDFLHQRLEDQFRELKRPNGDAFQENDDLLSFLPPRDAVHFVFGPPGTGKTERLARMLLQRMNGPSRNRILVVAPTNKAADVLTLRILELARKHPSAPKTDWLVRFGGTMDETLQKDGTTYREKNVDVSSFERLVLVTTVARYPYDKTRPNVGNGRPLRDENWAEVFMDEASMIELPYAIYLMLQQPHARFIIAGDPKQLPPVTKNPYLEERNVYSFLGLDSFRIDRTPIGDYAVQRLTKQYRSVPAIGNVFSRFAYNGDLEHARQPESRQLLGMETRMNLGPVNIIRFPFDTAQENIYRPRAVNGSSFHVYSALFAAEFSLFLDKIVSRDSRPVSIGIVSPYKIQADMISRIVENRQKEQSSRCRIVVGTAHKFQGDQCTIMIVCLNPPEHGSRRSLVNREALLNVSVSRASDYLFLMIPEKGSAGLENLEWMAWLENVCLSATETPPTFHAKEIEKEIFDTDDQDWLANNTFITGHMDVNVYDRPTKRFEVRYDNSAVDVQLSRTEPKLSAGENQTA